MGRFGVPAGRLINGGNQCRIGGVARGASHWEARRRTGDATRQGRGEYCAPVGSKQLHVDGAAGVLAEGAYGGVDAQRACAEIIGEVGLDGDILQKRRGRGVEVDVAVNSGLPPMILVF